MAKSFKQRLADLDKQHKTDLANKKKDNSNEKIRIGTGPGHDEFARDPV